MLKMYGPNTSANDGLRGMGRRALAMIRVLGTAVTIRGPFAVGAQYRVVLLALLCLLGAPAAAAPSAYITAGQGVVEIDTATNEVVRVIQGLFDSYGAAITSDGTRLYVSNQSPWDQPGTVQVVDVATGQTLSAIEVGYLPGPVVISPDDTRAYLGAFATELGLGGGPPDLYVIDLVNQQVIDVVEGAGGGLGGPAVSPDGRYVYACGRYDTVTREVDRESLCLSAYALSPDGNRLFFVTQPTFQTSGLLMLDFEAQSSYQLQLDIQRGPGGLAAALVASPDGSRVYWTIAGDGSGLDSLVVVTEVDEVFDTTGCPQNCASPPLTLVDTLVVPDFPAGIDITPDGARVFLASTASNVVSVIDTATNTITASIEVFSPTAFGRFIGPGGNGQPPPDNVPDPFAFEPVTGAGLETLLTSNAVTITGINASTAVTVSGGEYSIGCTTSFTAAPGSIQNNQTICLRHESATTFATQTITTLTIGGVSADFVSVTLDDPGPGPITTPNPFNFEPQDDVLLSTQVTSAPVAITGIEAPADVTVSNGSYSVGCTEAFTTGPGLIDNEETVCVRHVSAAACLTAVTTTLTVGGVQGTFTSTTIDDSVDSDGDGVSDCLDEYPFDASIATPALPGGNTMTVETASGSLEAVQVVAADDATNQQGRPEDQDFLYGLLSYRITGLNVGETVSVTLTYPAVLPAGSVIYKYDDVTGFVEFGGAMINGDTVTLTLTDGGEGDSDGQANGVIVDPVGVAVPAAPSSPSRGGGGGAVGWLVWLVLAGWLLARRAPREWGRRAT